jgi:hypothetical protein
MSMILVTLVGAALLAAIPSRPVVARARARAARRASLR